jgi:hypothetical protein
MAKQITLNQLGVMIESIEEKVKSLGEGQKILGDKVDKVDSKINQVHSSLKNEIKITSMIINNKLEEHIKQPSHAA